MKKSCGELIVREKKNHCVMVEWKLAYFSQFVIQSRKKETQWKAKVEWDLMACDSKRGCSSFCKKFSFNLHSYAFVYETDHKLLLWSLCCTFVKQLSAIYSSVIALLDDCNQDASLSVLCLGRVIKTNRMGSVAPLSYSPFSLTFIARLEMMDYFLNNVVKTPSDLNWSFKPKRVY